MANIIAFAGRKRSGKTMLSKFLRDEYGAVIITIADYLKYLCCDILNISYELLIEWKDNGKVLNVQPDERWFYLISSRASIDYNKVKEELSDRTIKDIRDMLQVVGTDVIRKYNENWHVNQMVESIKSYGEDKLITIDDVRFPNERKAIEELGGRVFFIINTFNMEVSNHISETSLTWRDFGAQNIILNTEYNEELFKKKFQIHFANNFKVYIHESILLSENIELYQATLMNPLCIEDSKFFRKFL